MQICTFCFALQQHACLLRLLQSLSRVLVAVLRLSQLLLPRLVLVLQVPALLAEQGHFVLRSKQHLLLTRHALGLLS